MRPFLLMLVAIVFTGCLFSPSVDAPTRNNQNNTNQNNSNNRNNTNNIECLPCDDFDCTEPRSAACEPCDCECVEPLDAADCPEDACGDFSNGCGTLFCGCRDDLICVAGACVPDGALCEVVEQNPCAFAPGNCGDYDNLAGCGVEATCTAGCGSTMFMTQNHGCLLNGGAMSCWGENNGGRIVDDGAVEGNTLGMTEMQLGTEFVSVNGGRRHSCGRTSSNIHVCQGDSSGNRFGPSTNRAQSNVFDSNFTVRDAESHDTGVCVIDQANSAVSCFGQPPVAENATLNVIGFGGAPLAAASILAHPTAQYACAILFDSRVVCWGNSPFGDFSPGEAEVIREPQSGEFVLHGVIARQSICLIVQKLGTLFLECSGNLSLQVPLTSSPTSLAATEDAVCMVIEGFLECEGQLPNDVQTVMGSFLTFAIDDADEVVAGDDAFCYRQPGQVKCFGDRNNGKAIPASDNSEGIVVIFPPE